MKAAFALLAAAVALNFSASAADVTVKLSEVHLCCMSCVKGVSAALKDFSAVKATCDQDAGTVELTGPNNATLERAVRALVAAGYYGKSDNADIKVPDNSGAKSEKVKALQVSGVHLCCAKCVKTVDAALKAVPGVESQTAEKGAKTFKVTGDFNEQDVFAALHKAGLAGKVGAE